MNEKMERMLEKMVDDFNEYSELVALSYAEDKEDEGFLQRGIVRRDCVEEYMVELAKVMGIKLKYGWDFEVYGRGEKKLKYRTVEIVKEG